MKALTDALVARISRETKRKILGVFLKTLGRAKNAGTASADLKHLSGTKALSSDMPFLSLLLSLQKYLLSFAIKISRERRRKTGTVDEIKPGNEFLASISQLMREYQESPQNWASSLPESSISATRRRQNSVHSEEQVVALHEALDFATITFESAESIVRVLLACAVAGQSEKISQQVLQSPSSAEAMALMEGIAVSYLASAKALPLRTAPDHSHQLTL